MKPLYHFVWILLLAAGGTGVAYAHPQVQKNPRLNREMARLEAVFFNADNLVEEKRPDTEKIRELLKQMETITLRLMASNPKQGLQTPLADLNQRILTLQKQAQAGNIRKLRKGFDELSEACFSCHLQHWVPLDRDKLFE